MVSNCLVRHTLVSGVTLQISIINTVEPRYSNSVNSTSPLFRSQAPSFDRYLMLTRLFRNPAISNFFHVPWNFEITTVRHSWLYTTYKLLGSLGFVQKQTTPAVQQSGCTVDWSRAQRGKVSTQSGIGRISGLKNPENKYPTPFTASHTPIPKLPAHVPHCGVGTPDLNWTMACHLPTCGWDLKAVHRTSSVKWPAFILLLSRLTEAFLRLSIECRISRTNRSTTCWFKN